jgi:hypothetical protein
VRALRRADDRGWLCWVALRCSQAWDWFDKRQIDAQLVAVFTLIVTYRLTEWAVHFASNNGDRPGAEVAMIIAAITGPWALLQTAVVKFYFDTRQGTYEARP